MQTFSGTEADQSIPLPYSEETRFAEPDVPVDRAMRAWTWIAIVGIPFVATIGYLIYQGWKS